MDAFFSQRDKTGQAIGGSDSRVGADTDADVRVVHRVEHRVVAGPAEEREEVDERHERDERDEASHEDLLCLGHPATARFRTHSRLPPASDERHGGPALVLIFVLQKNNHF